MSARVLVFCNGGVFQSVVTDNPEVEVTVIDYETDGSTGEKDVDGEPCEINRSHIIDPVTVEKYLGPGLKFPVKVRFGETIPLDERPIEENAFETREARDAYLQGLADYDGYIAYEVLEPDLEESDAIGKD